MELIPLLGTVIRELVKLFGNRGGDIPVCQTRIIRSGRGWPWKHRLGIHPRPDGKLEITRIP